MSLASHTNLAATDLLSWVPDFAQSSERLILNHPASSFAASSQPFLPTPSKSTLSRQPKEFLGVVIDAVRTVASYLPPRRINDLYNVQGDNLLCFYEWIEHTFSAKGLPVSSALDCSSAHDEIIVHFGETIQAKGCNHRWEPLDAPLQSQYLNEVKEFLRFLEDEEMPISYELRLFYAACYPSHDRRFGTTKQGRFCLLPQGAAEGDSICIPDGNKVPLVFRPIGDYTVNIGECYVQGMMLGQASTFDSGTPRCSFVVK